eukprot:s9820_g1.t3
MFLAWGGGDPAGRAVQQAQAWPCWNSLASTRCEPCFSWLLGGLSNENSLEEREDATGPLTDVDLQRTPHASCSWAKTQVDEESGEDGKAIWLPLPTEQVATPIRGRQLRPSNVTAPPSPDDLLEELDAEDQDPNHTGLWSEGTIPPLDIAYVGALPSASCRHGSAKSDSLLEDLPGKYVDVEEKGHQQQLVRKTCDSWLPQCWDDCQAENGFAQDDHGPARDEAATCDVNEENPVGEVRAPANSLEVLVLLSGMMSTHLAAWDCASLRAVCRDCREQLPTEVFSECFMNWMREKKPDIFAVTGEWCKVISAGELRTKSLGNTGLWIFFKHITWNRAWHAMLAAAQELRCHCFHPEERISKNAQWTLAVWAGHCFQTAASKGIRHFFVKDLLYWLQHADDEVRVEICRAFSSCGPLLLGRFNKSCVQALVRACWPNSSEACRSNALKAVRVFGAGDETLYSELRAHLVTAFRARRGLERWDVAQAVGDLNAQEGFRRMRVAWSTSMDFMSSTVSGLVSSVSIFNQLLVVDPFQACAQVEVADVA